MMEHERKSKATPSASTDESNTPAGASSSHRPAWLVFNRIFGSEIDANCVLSHVSVFEDRESCKIKVDINDDREACPICENWFPGSRQLERHREAYPASCDSCRLCFAADSAVAHAMSMEHSHCSVRGCKDPFREKLGWGAMMVEEHVKSCHGLARKDW